MIIHFFSKAVNLPLAVLAAWVTLLKGTREHLALSILWPFHGGNGY